MTEHARHATAPGALPTAPAHDAATAPGARPVRRRLIAATGAGALAALAAPFTATAQTTGWPTRPIRIIAPYPPGGPSDLLLRPMAEKLTATLKQPIVIDNKPGAGGNLGTGEIARAQPDGHTWGLALDTQVTINPHVYPRLGFRPEDLQPVLVATNFTQMLVCHPSLNVKTLAEFVALARRQPFNYASGGAGVPGHMAMEMLLDMAGVDLTHVPYKGPAPAMQDVMAGQVQCGFLATPTVLPQVKAGKLVPLAISGTKRSPVAPDVPTVAEAGYPGYDATFSLLLWAPRGVPEPIVAAMRTAFLDALKQPELVARLAAGDQDVVGTGTAEAATRISTMSRRWAAVAKKINLSLD